MFLKTKQTRDSSGFEWYNQYSSFKDHILKYMKKEDKILVLGCGDSSKGWVSFINRSVGGFVQGRI